MAVAKVARVQSIAGRENGGVGAPTVRIDLLVRSLLTIGASRRDIARAIARMRRSDGPARVGGSDARLDEPYCTAAARVIRVMIGADSMGDDRD